MVLPFTTYKPGRLGNVLKRRGLNVCFNSRGNLKELVGRVKKGRRKKCKKLYYGQTKRRVVSRDEEHDRAIRKSQPEKYAVADHCLTHRHGKEPAKLIKQVDNFWELDTWESMFITNEPEENLMNTEEPPMKSSLFKFARMNI